MDDILKQLLQEEQELQFDKFNEDTAWKIGCLLVEHSVREGLPVTIDITRGDHQLFHASLRGHPQTMMNGLNEKSALYIGLGIVRFTWGNC